MYLCDADEHLVFGVVLHCRANMHMDEDIRQGGGEIALIPSQAFSMGAFQARMK